MAYIPLFTIGTVVKIQVNGEGRMPQALESSIQENSPYLSNILSTKAVINGYKHVRLQLEQDFAGVEAVDTWAQWITNEPALEGDGYTFVLLADCYLLGKKLEDDRFCRAAVKGIAYAIDQSYVRRTGACQIPDYTIVNRIWEYTEPGDIARRSILDAYKKVGTKEGLEQNVFHPEFKDDLLILKMSEGKKSVVNFVRE